MVCVFHHPVLGLCVLTDSITFNTHSSISQFEENFGRNFSILTGAFLLIMTTMIVTYFATTVGNHGCDFPVEHHSIGQQSLKFTQQGSMDMSDTMHIPDKKITIIRGIASNRCYVVTNDRDVSPNRALSVMNSLLTSDHLETIGGHEAAEFCKGLPIVPVQVLSENQPIRPKRDEASDKATAEAQKKFKSHSNECAENVIVQCADSTNVYKCVTGPREVYRASTECTSSTQFRFNITTRCKEFEATKGDRWIKCLQKFILNQQGPGGVPADQPVPAAGQPVPSGAAAQPHL